MKQLRSISLFILILSTISCESNLQKSTNDLNEKTLKSLKVFLANKKPLTPQEYDCLQVFVIPKFGCNSCISAAENTVMTKEFTDVLVITESIKLSKLNYHNVVYADEEDNLASYAFVTGTNPIILQIENGALTYRGFVLPGERGYKKVMRRFQKKCADSLIFK